MCVWGNFLLNLKLGTSKAEVVRPADFHVYEARKLGRETTFMNKKTWEDAQLLCEPNFEFYGTRNVTSR